MRNTVCRVVAALGLVVLAAPAQSQVVQRFDPIYDHQSQGDHHLRGDAIWVVFARCAALHSNTDLLIEYDREHRASERARASPERLSMFESTPEGETESRERSTRRAEGYIQEGLKIMAQDRPGQSVEAEFRAQMAREVAELSAYPYTTPSSLERMDDRCSAFSQAIRQNALIAGRRLARGPGIPVSVPLTQEMIARIRARDGY